MKVCYVEDGSGQPSKKIPRGQLGRLVRLSTNCYACFRCKEDGMPCHKTLIRVCTDNWVLTLWTKPFHSWSTSTSCTTIIIARTKWRHELMLVSTYTIIQVVIQGRKSNGLVSWELFVTQRPKTRRLSEIIYGDTSKNRREGFSSLQFFNSAGVREFVIIFHVNA